MIHSAITNPTVEQEYTNIFNQYSDKLCDYLYKRFGDYEKAKDITQESFIKLWNNRDKISFKKAKGYLFVVANNSFINSLKRCKVANDYVSQADASPVSSTESPEYLLEEKEFLKKLETAIASLPEKQREVLVMNRFKSKTYKTIALELQISVKTVEKRMQAALIAITQAIGKDIKSYRL